MGNNKQELKKIETIFIEVIKIILSSNLGIRWNAAKTTIQIKQSFTFPQIPNVTGDVLW